MDTNELDEWFSSHQDELAPYRTRYCASLEDEVELDRGLLRLLFDAGLSRHGWPEHASGLGGDETDRARLYDAIARAGLRVPEAFVLLETLGPVLVEHAPQLAQRHLPAFLAGTQLWGQGFSEPNAGSDLAGIRTRAVSADGVLRLSGQKIWTTLGQCAQWALVLCRTDPEATAHRGLSMVWVDLTAHGVDVRAIEASNGRNEFAEMFFSDVEVPLDHVVGELGAGWSIAMYLLQFERGMYAWGRQAALHRSLGHGIGSAGRHAVQPSVPNLAAIGQAFTTLTALRTRSATTVARLAARETLGPEASIDKVLLSQAEQQTFDALRLLAGARFLVSDEDDQHRLREEWFYSRATSIFGGAVEIQRGIIAERLLGLPKEPRRGA